MKEYILTNVALLELKINTLTRFMCDTNDSMKIGEYADQINAKRRHLLLLNRIKEKYIK